MLQRTGLLVFALLLLLAAPLVAQRTEVVHRSAADTAQNSYLIYHPSGVPQALLVLLPGYGGDVNSFAPSSLFTPSMLPSRMAVRNVLTVVTVPAAETLHAADSLSVALAGQNAGRQQGQAAGIGMAVMGSAAATLFLTPYVGGVGSIVAAMLAPGTPFRVPNETPEAAHPAYQQAYRDAYKQAYRPRLRRAVAGSVLLTSLVWIAVVSGMGG